MRWKPSRNALPWWLLVVSLCFNLGFGATYGVRTYTPPSPKEPREARPDPPRPVREALNLTSEQAEKFGEANRKMFEETKELRSQMRIEQQTLTELIAEAEPDLVAIGEQLDAIASLQRQHQELMINNLLAQRELLEPEQVPAFNRVIRRYIGPRGGMGGFEGGRHGRGRSGDPSSGRDRGPGGRGERGPERGREPGDPLPPEHEPDPDRSGDGRPDRNGDWNR